MNISVLLLYLITDHRVDRRVVPMLLPVTWAKIPPWPSETDPGTVSADGNPVRSKTHADSKQSPAMARLLLSPGRGARAPGAAYRRDANLAFIHCDWCRAARRDSALPDIDAQGWISWG